MAGFCFYSEFMSDFKASLYRTAVVLNKKAAFHHQMAGISHTLLGLPQLNTGQDFGFHDYADASGQSHGKISDYPIAILTADNSNKLRQLRADAADAGIKTNDFLETMLRENSEAQLRDTAAKPEAEHEYIAVALFGAGDVIRELTKKFSVYKGPSAG